MKGETDRYIRREREKDRKRDPNKFSCTQRYFWDVNLDW